MTRRGLGKGLGALLGEYLEPEADASEVRTVSLAAIVPNPLQPRRSFSEEELEELAASIRENGLLQPLVVRTAPGTGDRYELVAGERRFRALNKLGWREAPVLVREASDETLLVLALVENLQREALNPMEEATGFKALADRFGLTQAQIADAVGKNRSTVANLLRLLNLPPSVRKLVEAGQLSMGHARALLSVADPMRAAQLARDAVREGWSVRTTERRCATAREGSPAARKGKRTRPRDPAVQALEDALRDRLGTRVRIRPGAKGKGVIEVPYSGNEDFERLFEIIVGRPAHDVLD
ncbi:MAG: ParB/RepB/Spo0J family partition protein [Gemmatimonadota bacterium]